jgi:hypothetical protein
MLALWPANWFDNLVMHVIFQNSSQIRYASYFLEYSECQIWHYTLLKNHINLIT